jgi:DNA-binding NarL/FixJ family response regulator
MTANVLIVEDHPLYRDALSQRVQLAFPAMSVLHCGSVEESPRAASPGSVSLILLDQGLPGASGTEAILVVRRLFPNAPIVMVCASEERRDAAAAMRAGARAVISKAAPTEVMLDVLRRVLAGDFPEPQWIAAAGAAVAFAESRPTLTPRQGEILGLLCQAKTNRDIGEMLGLAEITVKQHVSAVFKVLNVSNRTQALLQARRLGVCSSED